MSPDKPAEEDGWCCPFSIDAVGRDVVAGGGGISEFASKYAVLACVMGFSIRGRRRLLCGRGGCSVRGRGEGGGCAARSA